MTTVSPSTSVLIASLDAALVEHLCLEESGRTEDVRLGPFRHLVAQPLDRFDVHLQFIPPFGPHLRFAGYPPLGRAMVDAAQIDEGGDGLWAEAVGEDVLFPAGMIAREQCGMVGETEPPITTGTGGTKGDPSAPAGSCSPFDAGPEAIDAIVDIEGVTGSIPVTPTIRTFPYRLAAATVRQMMCGLDVRPDLPGPAEPTARSDRVVGAFGRRLDLPPRLSSARHSWSCRRRGRHTALPSPFPCAGQPSALPPRRRARPGPAQPGNRVAAPQ